MSWRDEKKRQEEIRYILEYFDFIVGLEDPSPKINEVIVMVEYKFKRNDPAELSMAEVANIYQKVRYVQGIDQRSRDRYFAKKAVAR